METAVVIVIIVVVVLGLLGIVLGPITAANSGGKVSSAFSQAYRQEFGVAPSSDAERAISTGSAIIYNAMGSGQYSYPSENLYKTIREYGAAVGWNESKMELGLGCLLAVCSTKNMNVAPGCQWAADVIIDCITRYCPSMTRRTLGYQDCSIGADRAQHFIECVIEAAEGDAAAGEATEGEAAAGEAADSSSEKPSGSFGGPSGGESGGMGGMGSSSYHMASFDYAYRCIAAMEWLFQQQ